MSSYVGLPEKSREAISDDGWYLNCGDVCFWLHAECEGGGPRPGPQGSREYFWQSRISHMLIRGGANYAFDAIASEVLLKFGISMSSLCVSIIHTTITSITFSTILGNRSDKISSL